MNNIKKDKIYANVGFVFLILLALDFFDCIPIKNTFNLPLTRQLLGIGITILTIPQLLSRRCIFRNEYIIIIVSLILCSFSSYILYNQNFYESFKGISNYLFGLSIYLYALHFRINESFVLKLLIILSLCFLTILIIQQFSYPKYIFCGRIEREWNQTLEIRMGLYRFTLHGIWLVVLTMMLVFPKLMSLKNGRFWYIVLFVLLLGSVVINLERKVLYSCFATLLIGLLYYRGFTYKKMILFLFIIAVSFFLLKYMEDLNERTNSELNDSNFVRFLAMKYFLFDMNSSVLYYLFGAGLPGASSLGNKIDKLEDVYSYFLVDIGVIGYMVKVGIIGLISYLLVVYKIISKRHGLDIGLLMFLFSFLLVCIFKFWGNHISDIATFSIYMYLINCNIRRHTFSNTFSLILKHKERYECNL